MAVSALYWLGEGLYLHLGRNGCISIMGKRDRLNKCPLPLLPTIRFTLAAR